MQRHTERQMLDSSKIRKLNIEKQNLNIKKGDK